MIVAAAVGTGCGTAVTLRARSERFARIARELEYPPGFDFATVLRLSKSDPRDTRRCQMGLKYERAARYPWLPVDPDPPEPK
jgi:hypothetical protein